MSKLSTIVTKASKSWTLIFNWGITILAIAAEVALQNIPALHAAVSPEMYIYVIIGITVVNKLLRAKTDSALDNK